MNTSPLKGCCRLKQQGPRKDLLKFSQAVVQSAYNQPVCFNQDARQAADLAEQRMEDHVRPTAKRADITKRIGWHTLRHTIATLLKANEDVATVQALMRHANVSVSMNTHVQAVTPAKRKAQQGIMQIREVAPHGPGAKSEMPASALSVPRRRG